MKTQVIQLPEGWKIDKIENNKIILKESKEQFPKTWEICFNKLENKEYINNISSINYIRDDAVGTCTSVYKNALPYNYGKKVLALEQLLVCRNAWWKVLNYTPDWADTSEKYCIIRTGLYGFELYVYSAVMRTFAFPSKEVAEDFLAKFRDLFEQADDLI